MCIFVNLIPSIKVRRVGVRNLEAEAIAAATDESSPNTDQKREALPSADSKLK